MSEAALNNEHLGEISYRLDRFLESVSSSQEYLIRAMHVNDEGALPTEGTESRVLDPFMPEVTSSGSVTTVFKLPDGFSLHFSPKERVEFDYSYRANEEPDEDDEEYDPEIVVAHELVDSGDGLFLETGRNMTIDPANPLVGKLVRVKIDGETLVTSIELVSVVENGRVLVAPINIHCIDTDARYAFYNWAIVADDDLSS